MNLSQFEELTSAAGKVSAHKFSEEVFFERFITEWDG